MTNRPRQLQILGHAEMRSPWFSSLWTLSTDAGRIAEVQRLGRIYASRARIADGREWLIEPCGAGEVHVLDADAGEVARITRRSWLGRRWDITASSFMYELTSRPAPRHWHIGVGGAPVAELHGSLTSYNRVDIDAQLSLPVETVLLAWHVVARPWEAAAAPRGLVPVPARPPEARLSPAPPPGVRPGGRPRVREEPA
jgi:hypothetical protein